MSSSYPPPKELKKRNDQLLNLIVTSKKSDQVHQRINRNFYPNFADRTSPLVLCPFLDTLIYYSCL